MKEVKFEIPPLLSDWQLPKWTHLQIKSMCSGDSEYEKVGRALVRMCGGDHQPNAGVGSHARTHPSPNHANCSTKGIFTFEPAAAKK